MARRSPGRAGALGCWMACPGTAPRRRSIPAHSRSTASGKHDSLNADCHDAMTRMTHCDISPGRPPSADHARIAAANMISRRSEEHTSELQSLMRNSYAVFCLKKKEEATHKHN